MGSKSGPRTRLMMDTVSRQMQDDLKKQDYNNRVQQMVDDGRRGSEIAHYQKTEFLRKTRETVAEQAAFQKEKRDGRAKQYSAVKSKVGRNIKVVKKVEKKKNQPIRETWEDEEIDHDLSIKHLGVSIKKKHIRDVERAQQDLDQY